MVLGDYVSSLQATALTRKRPESGAANPDIVSIRNKRFIYLQEPDEREPLNTSRMKQFSGEDIVEARGLFEDQQRFKISEYARKRENSEVKKRRQFKKI
jgi:putative DNA primase/helicase